MNEFQHINFKISDLLDADSQLRSFPNGFRHDPADLFEREFVVTLPKNGARMLDCFGIHVNKDFYKRRIINHSWEPLELELDSEFWNIQYTDRHAKFGGGYDQLIVLHSELSNSSKQLENGVHWFANGYLCAEHWYRLYKDIRIVADYRPILTRWICANRLIDNKRVYRIEFLNRLDTTTGTYSLPDNDPQTQRTPNEIFPDNSVLPRQFDDGANSSAWITVNQETPINSAFLHVVTETVIDRIHLTEKIFKPIVLKQPFVLVGGAGCLKYLQSYGFKTFDNWWSEDYDSIIDDQERMQACANIVNWIGTKDISELEQMRNTMKEVLDYNYNWFYNGFSKNCWDELLLNISNSVAGDCSNRD